MIGPRPNFMDSPYFVMEEDNWHLKPNAPKEVVDEFNKFMKDDSLLDNKALKKSFSEQIDDIIRR